MTKSAVGQRGKEAEKTVQKHLDYLNGKHHDFAYSRLPDARAAGGRLAASLCDYLVFYRGLALPLEVKSTAHDYRLPKDKLSQLAILKKTRVAGAKPFVLIYHTDLKMWRVAPVTYFNFGVPSWDLSDLVLYNTAADALASTNVFPT